MSHEYLSFGRFYCPVCAYRREFIQEDVGISDAAWAYCEVCGYQFGYASNDLTGEVKPVLTVEMVNRARAEFVEDYKRQRISGGDRLEWISGRAKVAPRSPEEAEDQRGRR